MPGLSRVCSSPGKIGLAKDHSGVERSPQILGRQTELGHEHEARNRLGADIFDRQRKVFRVLPEISSGEGQGVITLAL